MATLTVRGEAVVPAEPDDVALALEIDVVRATPEEAFGDVAARSARVEQVLDELGVARGTWSTTGVSVGPHHEYDDRGRREHRGYVAANRVLVRVADKSVLSTLMRLAVERAQARIQGPWWRIALSNPARYAAYREAAAAARSKAEAYAEALGGRLGAITSVSEPGLSEPSVYGSHHVRETAVFGATIEESRMHIEPGELNVSAALDVTFALDEGRR